MERDFVLSLLQDDHYLKKFHPGPTVLLRMFLFEVRDLREVFIT